VVYALGKRVPGEIDAVVLEPLRALLVRRGVGPHRFLGQEAARLLAGRGPLGTVELRGALDAAVADEDDVVRVGVPARHRKGHVRDARTPPAGENAGGGGLRAR